MPIFENIDRAYFENEIVPAARPVVLRSLVSDWPIVAAAKLSPNKFADYVTAVPATAPVKAWFGAPTNAGRFGYSDDLKDFDHERREVTLTELLAYILAHGDDPTAFSAYAGGIPIGATIPALRAALPMPLLEESRETLVSLWLGTRTRTAAHWDVPQNLACVVLGRRRFTLFPTEQVKNLYVGPLDFTLAGQPISLVDFAAPDLTRYPNFTHAMAAAEVAELGPGDALYVPSLWWHHVESLDPVGAMINFWWRDGPDYLMTPLLTLFHALLTLRELPETERDAWRTMFDHYIFGTNGDPMSHLPEDARGVFGAMTPEIRKRITTIIAGTLRP
ncbi:cupin-like domain-containing protein [Sphingomonas sp. HMP9]|uniref:cupin-like domain-containing protein n=1 Tax=Sphingomonas sp. HMP9 TaxID=1517554 RepID=UPI0018D8CACE|nr:cupin-like domain-containing protein [Sphingomonas sp. HMP9]